MYPRLHPRPGRLFLGCLALITATVAVASPAFPATAGVTTLAAHRAPATIEVAAPNHFPEAVDWDARRCRFVVGTSSFGTVSTVALDGTLKPLVTDPRLGPIVVGIRVDAERDRVLATTLSIDGSTSGVGSYDLASGTANWFVDLVAVAGDGGPHFTNDVAVDSDGTAYVVDGVSPTVFKVDRRGRASVLLRDDRLGPNRALPGFLPNFGVSTVAALPGGYLIIAKADGTLWRLPVRHPSQLSQVTISGALGDYIDGARVFDNGDLGVVTNGWFGAPPSAQRLRLSQGGRLATVLTTRTLTDPLPTGIAPGPGHSTYVMSGRLDLAFTGRPSEGFSLHTVRL